MTIYYEYIANYCNIASGLPTFSLPANLHPQNVSSVKPTRPEVALQVPGIHQVHSMQTVCIVHDLFNMRMLPSPSSKFDERF